MWRKGESPAPFCAPPLLPAQFTPTCVRSFIHSFLRKFASVIWLPPPSPWARWKGGGGGLQEALLNAALPGAQSCIAPARLLSFKGYLWQLLWSCLALIKSRMLPKCRFTADNVVLFNQFKSLFSFQSVHVNWPSSSQLLWCAESHLCCANELILSSITSAESDCSPLCLLGEFVCGVMCTLNK